ncbi:hypothetical protein [Hyphomicrobium sp. 99]|uniref:hypothetical protein n=1 Tax=Hyphomicrobium sp. 99 TaxID=1163419 RepID=UPI0005F8859E|nr:hypothetical protein [Hyphomicrobium sp. 99]
MIKAQNCNTTTTEKRTAVDRRSALRLIGSGIAAGGTTLPAIASAKDESAIERHFAIWKRHRKQLRHLDRCIETALSNYETIAPEWPDSLRYSDAATGWRFYCSRADTVSRHDKSGKEVRFFGVKAVSAAIKRLTRLCPADAPILIEAIEALGLAESLEARENEAGKLSGLDDFERDFDAQVATVGAIAETILAIEPTSAEDLRLQATVIRESDIGLDRYPGVMKFVNAVMTAQFEV